MSKINWNWTSKPKIILLVAPAPTRPIVPRAAPVGQADEGQVNDTSAVIHPPAHTVAAMFDGPKLKDYLPFMKVFCFVYVIFMHLRGEIV